MKYVKMIAFVVLAVPHDQVLAQIYPDYLEPIENAIREDPANEKLHQIHLQQENELKALFRDLPPVEVLAVDGGSTKQLAHKNDIELELRQSGIKLKEDNGSNHVTLLAQISQGHDGTWNAILELKEWVTLNRPDSPTIYSVTYIDETNGSPTRQRAEEIIDECVKDFCLQYMKYGK